MGEKKVHLQLCLESYLLEFDQVSPLVGRLSKVFRWNVDLVAQKPSLQVMSTISSSEKIIPTTIEYLDIAGLVKGASQGEGLGNKFLSNIRECDSIVQVHAQLQSLQARL